MDRAAKRAKLAGRPSSGGAAKAKKATKTTTITKTTTTTTTAAAKAKTAPKSTKSKTPRAQPPTIAPAESEGSDDDDDEAAEEGSEREEQNDDGDDDEEEDADGSSRVEDDNGRPPEKQARNPPGDDAPDQPGDAPEDDEQPKSFKDLGLIESLCEACDKLSWAAPTPIQAKSIPHALAGRDVIGLAETGSGKTGAFALPVLQALLARPQPLFALVLAPTRELASQIGQAFEALGSLISLRCAVVVGGLDMVQQAIALGKKPHVVVATPGRLVDHLEKTKGFSLRTVKYLVMDEADRLLDMDFGPAIDKLLKFIPRERNTMLFSATMSNKVESLQRASLRDPVRVSISASRFQTVSTLLQNYIFKPVIQKDVHLVYLINEFAGKSIIIFTRTVYETNRIAFLLRTLGFGAIPLNGNMNQAARLGALNKFRAGNRNILVATDVAARGLDIPKVDLVVQFDLAQSSETYIHRVGRTARAGKSGRAISFVTQYDLELWLRLEAALGRKLEEYPTEKEEVMAFMARVEEAQRHARIEMKNLQEGGGKGGRGGGGGGGGARGGKPGRGGKRTRDEMDAEEG